MLAHKVPAGTGTGSVDNSVIEGLNTEIDVLEDRVETLEDEVDALGVGAAQSEIDSLNTEIDGLETQVETLEMDVETLETQVAAIDEDFVEVDTFEELNDRFNALVMNFETALDTIDSLTTQLDSTVAFIALNEAPGTLTTSLGSTFNEAALDAISQAVASPATGSRFGAGEITTYTGFHDKIDGDIGNVGSEGVDDIRAAHVVGSAVGSELDIAITSTTSVSDAITAIADSVLDGNAELNTNDVIGFDIGSFVNGEFVGVGNGLALAALAVEITTFAGVDISTLTPEAARTAALSAVAFATGFDVATLSSADLTALGIEVTTAVANDRATTALEAADTAVAGAQADTATLDTTAGLLADAQAALTIAQGAKVTTSVVTSAIADIGTAISDIGVADAAIHTHIGEVAAVTAVSLASPVPTLSTAEVTALDSTIEALAVGAIGDLYGTSSVATIFTQSIVSTTQGWATADVTVGEAITGIVTDILNDNLERYDVPGISLGISGISGITDATITIATSLGVTLGLDYRAAISAAISAISAYTGTPVADLTDSLHGTASANALDFEVTKVAIDNTLAAGTLEGAQAYVDAKAAVPGLETAHTEAQVAFDSPTGEVQTAMNAIGEAQSF